MQRNGLEDPRVSLANWLDKMPRFRSRCIAARPSRLQARACRGKPAKVPAPAPAQRAASVSQASPVPSLALRVSVAHCLSGVAIRRGSIWLVATSIAFCRLSPHPARCAVPAPSAHLAARHEDAAQCMHIFGKLPRQSRRLLALAQQARARDRNAASHRAERPRRARLRHSAPRQPQRRGHRPHPVCRA